MESARQEVQDFVRLCETLLSPALNDTLQMNIVECAVIKFYASQLVNRCDALFHEQEEGAARPTSSELNVGWGLPDFR